MSGCPDHLRDHPGVKVTCREFIEFLMDYLDGRLPEERRRIFDQHLSLCASCVNYLRSYQETVRMGRAVLTQSDEAVPGSVPEGLVEAILAARKQQG